MLFRSVFNCAMGRSTSLLQLIETLNQRLGTNIRPQLAPPRTGDVKHSLADIQAARACLNYEPVVSLDEGLGRTIEFYRDWLANQAERSPTTREGQAATPTTASPKSTSA